MHPFRSLTLLFVLPLLGAGGCSLLQPFEAHQDAPSAEKVPPAEKAPPPPAPPPSPPPLPERPEAGPEGPAVWGLAGVRGFSTGAQSAPNGVEFKPLFSLDFNFNLWLWRDQGLYAFANSRFWGQKAAPGITNASQGAFDFSKREFDMDLGLAWNYAGPFEARVFAYSMNNLNRGEDLARPSGFKDGLGLENRWYVAGSYGDLGRPDFDVARATFLSVGYYPTKEMVDAFGNSFKPGPFARAYLTFDLIEHDLYLFADVQAIATQSCTPKLLWCDEGVAWRPFPALPRLEFRAGSEGRLDFAFHELNLTFYGSARFIY